MLSHGYTYLLLLLLALPPCLAKHPPDYRTLPTDPYFGYTKLPRKCPIDKFDHTVKLREIGIVPGQPFRLRDDSPTWLPDPPFWKFEKNAVMIAHEQGGKRRTAAIKVIFSGGENDKEIVAANTLGNHPNVLEVYETGVKGSRRDAVVISEWATFGILADYVTYHRKTLTKPIHPLVGRHLFLDILSGLHHVHSRQRIHDDFHAGNILLTAVPGFPGRAVAKLSDFGTLGTLRGTDHHDDLKKLCIHFRSLVVSQQPDVIDPSRDE